MSTLGHIEAVHGTWEGEFVVRRRAVVRWVLMGLIFIAAGLRFWGLEREGRHGDEYIQTMAYGMSPKYVAMWTQTLAQPPLDPWIGWAMAKISPELWAMRAPAAFFGVVSVGLCYVLLRRVGQMPSVALLASAIVAFSPLHWRMSQTARPYTIFCVGFLLTLLALLAALERPDRRRLAVYGLVAFAMTWTRGFGPLVVLLSVWLVVAAMYVCGRWGKTACGPDVLASLLRVGAVTTVVGLAALPLLAFLMAGASDWTVAGAEGEAISFGAVMGRLGSNAAIWWGSMSDLLGPLWYVVLATACVGAIGWLRRWSTHVPAVGVLAATGLVAGPLYLLVFSIAISVSPIRDRYGLFLLPAIGAFSAGGLVALMRAVRARVPGKSGYVGSALAVVLVLASPAWGTVGWMGLYGNPDWRGCAAFLRDKVTVNDTVIVLADRPLGETQPPFWGKIDLPEGVRPLGESAWTLATSASHGDRFLAQSGRCYVVVMHFPTERGRSGVEPVGGLEAAPEGMALKKFRRLDLLWAKQADSDADGCKLAACAALAGIPLEFEPVRAIPLLLTARMRAARGDDAGAAEALISAKRWVPPSQRAWFDRIAADAIAAATNARKD